MKKMYALLGTVVLLAACSAEFTDLRPTDSNAGVGGFDTGTENSNDRDSGRSNTGNVELDSGDEADSDNADSETAADNDTLIATGEFVNVDYDTSGSAEYWRLADGSYEVRLSADFSVRGVPGPAIALSPRNPLGGSIDADELGLGGLDSSSGAQAYSLPGPPDAYAYVWIWCEPFGLDVSFAQMEFQ